MSDREQSDWWLFRNTTAEIIPAWACIEIHGSERSIRNKNTFLCRRIQSGAKEYAFNGPTSIRPGERGRCTRSVGFVLRKQSDGAPVLGEMWGPQAGEWEIARGKTGVRILGPEKDGKVRASLESEGGSSTNAALAIADEGIPAASDSDPRVPGENDVNVIKGSGSGDWQNWSLIEIPAGSYVVGIEIEGAMVTVAAFC